MPARSFHSFVEYLRAFRRSRALRGDIFMRQKTFSLHANWIPFDFIVGLTRTWPHVIAFRESVGFSQDNLESLQTSRRKRGAGFLRSKKMVFEENAGRRVTETRNVKDICIYKKKEANRRRLGDIARSRSNRIHNYILWKRNRWN